MRTIEFILPRRLAAELPNLLPPSILTRADDARWLIHQIVRKTSHRDLDEWGFARLHSDVLKRVMDHHSIRPISDALQAAGAIELATHRAQTRAKGYRIRGAWCDAVVSVRATDPRFIDRAVRERQRLRDEERRKWQRVDYALDAQQQRLTIVREVDAVLDAMEPAVQLSQGALVQQIRRGDWHYTIGSTGRRFNSITSLSRVVRPHLRIDDDALGAVDLRCAQMGLLALLISRKYPSTCGKRPEHNVTPAIALSSSFLLLLSSLSATLFSSSAEVEAHGPFDITAADVQDFCAVASQGRLYGVLAETVGREVAWTKQHVLVDLLAPRHAYPCPIAVAFGNLWPTVYELIRWVTAADHSRLIRILQRAESALVCETVAPRIVACGVPCITLHDAVFGRLRDLDTVDAAFREVFAELGFWLGTKRECSNGG